MNEQDLNTQLQEGNTGQQLPFHTHNGVDSPVITVSESSLNLADITTGNATTSRHGLLPKLSGNATDFLDGTGAWDTVKDSDLSISDVTTNNVTTSKHGFITKAPNDATKFFDGTAAWSVPSITAITTTSITAGETLTAGEVVTLTTKSGSIYGIRAAAQDTTYGKNIAGIAYENITIGNTGKIMVAGITTALSGLTSDTTYYLKNYGTSSETITQTSQDAEFNVTTSHVIRQTWTATSSKMDKLIVYGRKNGGGACILTCELKRANTVLDTQNVDLGANSAILAEKTIDFTDTQIYKGETLNFRFTMSTDFGYLGYKSGGDVYSGGLLILDLGTGTIADGSDIYMKVFEYGGFGLIDTAAGTRKIKIGTAFSATGLIYQLQYGDLIL